MSFKMSYKEFLESLPPQGSEFTWALYTLYETLIDRIIKLEDINES